MGVHATSAAVGRLGSGIPSGKMASPSPSLFETLNRNRSRAPPAGKRRPQPSFPPGWGAMTHPFPLLFLVCVFSSRPRGGPTQPLPQ